MLQIDPNDPLHAIKTLGLPGFRSSQSDSDDARSDAPPEPAPRVASTLPAKPSQAAQSGSASPLAPDPNEPLDVAAALGMPGFRSSEERRARMSRGEPAVRPTDKPQAAKPAPSPAPVATPPRRTSRRERLLKTPLGQTLAKGVKDGFVIRLKKGNGGSIEVAGSEISETRDPVDNLVTLLRSFGHRAARVSVMRDETKIGEESIVLSDAASIARLREKVGLSDAFARLREKVGL
jgi:hypothetical protein